MARWVMRPNQSFHLVEPRGIGGGVVHVIAGLLRQPSTHLGVFVGDVVIDDEVKVQNRRQQRFSYELFITAHCRYGDGASAHHKSEAPRHEPAL